MVNTKPKLCVTHNMIIDANIPVDITTRIYRKCNRICNRFFGCKKISFCDRFCDRYRQKDSKSIAKKSVANSVAKINFATEIHKLRMKWLVKKSVAKSVAKLIFATEFATDFWKSTLIYGLFKIGLKIGRKVKYFATDFATDFCFISLILIEENRSQNRSQS